LPHEYEPLLGISIPSTIINKLNSSSLEIEEIKLPLLISDIIVYTKNSKESAKQNFLRPSSFEKTQNTILIHTTIFLYINNEQLKPNELNNFYNNSKILGYQSNKACRFYILESTKY
jgi:hypothetical protein